MKVLTSPRTYRANIALALGLLLSCGAGMAHAAPQKPLAFTGTNLSGAEFGNPKPGLPMVYGKDHTYPTENEVNYFASKGMNVFRVPFHWEAMQPTPGGPIDPEELRHLQDIVKAITGKGLVALIDPHNYARYGGKVVGGPEITDEQFALFWGALASTFKDNPRVWFGLMNEPHDLPTPQWLDAANAAVAAIRKTGAKNLILVPGNDWTGAHSWVSGSGDAMLGIKDPANHYIFEVHQYLDADSSGTKTTVVSPTIGVERLQAFVAWCRKHHQRAFLGEFAAGGDDAGRVAIDSMLTSMENDRDVWVGFTWWSAGPWWGDYMFSLEPKDLNDRPQLTYLLPHLQRTAVVPMPLDVGAK